MHRRRGFRVERSGLEGGGESAVAGEPDHVVDPIPSRHVDRPVGRAVIDHQPLDGVEADDLARQLCEHRGEGFLLVQAGDLDDELHRRAMVAAPLGRVLPPGRRGRGQPRPGPREGLTK